MTVAHRYQEVTAKDEDKDEYGRVPYPVSANSEMSFNAKAGLFTVTWRAFRDQWDKVIIPAALLAEECWEERIKAQMVENYRILQEAAAVNAEQEELSLQKRKKELFEALKEEFEGKA